MVKLALSDIVQPKLGAACVGTRVLDSDRLISAVTEAIATHDTRNDRAPGQHFIMLPPACVELVSCGIARRTTDPADFLPREHRGRVELFMLRSRALPCTGVAAIVYTIDAYVNDPQVDDTRADFDSDVTHVLVDVLGFSDGPAPQLSPARFTANLAGGNNEALAWSADEIRAKAEEVDAYDSEFCVVADPEAS